MSTPNKPIAYTCLAVGVLMAAEHFAFADEPTVEDIAAPAFGASTAPGSSSLSSSVFIRLTMADPNTGQSYEAQLEKSGAIVIAELVG